jgi:hypothetical protein
MRTVKDLEKMIETIRELYTPDPLCPYCGSQTVMRCKCGANKSCDCGYGSGVSSCDCNPPITCTGILMWCDELDEPPCQECGQIGLHKMGCESKGEPNEK